MRGGNVENHTRGGVYENKQTIVGVYHRGNALGGGVRTLGIVGE